VNSRHVLTAARGVALAIVVVMIFYFATADVIRSDNPFLVPDALLTAFLLAAALSPRRIAAAALIFAFTWDIAVYTTSLSNHAVRGTFTGALDHFALIVPSLVMAVLLAHGIVKTTSTSPEGNADTERAAKPAHVGGSR
jgi:hypothetical protein